MKVMYLCFILNLQEPKPGKGAKALKTKEKYDDLYDEDWRKKLSNFGYVINQLILVNNLHLRAFFSFHEI